MISACMIVRDGAETLERALTSIKGYCDEIVIGIDTRTIDNTEEIAKKFGAITFPLVWQNDFAFARNLVASRAKYDWILVVDADDKYETGKGHLMYKAIRDDCDLGYVTVDVGDGGSVQSVRLYNRNLFRYRFAIHECVVPFETRDYKRGDIGVTIVHRHASVKVEPDRNINMLTAIVNDMPRYLLFYGQELLYLRRYEDGVRAFIRCIMFNGCEPQEIKEAKFGLATCYANLHDSVNARKQCYSLLLDDENWMPALNLLGQMDMIEGKTEESIRWFEMALKVKPTEYVFDNTMFMMHNTLGNLSVLYAMVGRDAEARKVYKMAKDMKINEEWLSKTVGGIFN